MAAGGSSLPDGECKLRTEGWHDGHDSLSVADYIMTVHALLDPCPKRYAHEEHSPALTALAARTSAGYFLVLPLAS